MKFSFYLLLFIIIGMVSCQNPPCKYSYPQKIMSVPTSVDKMVGNVDYVLVDGLAKKCLDSSEVVSLVLKYVLQQEQSEHYTIAEIFVLNKVVDFDSGENLSQPSTFFENILLGISMDSITKLPKGFIFFDSDGEEVFSDVWEK